MATGVPLSSVEGGEDDPLSVLFPDLVAEVMQHAGGALGPSASSEVHIQSASCMYTCTGLHIYRIYVGGGDFFGTVKLT